MCIHTLVGVPKAIRESGEIWDSFRLQEDHKNRVTYRRRILNIQ